MGTTAAEIAATILDECYSRKIEVSNLKLQKLLYYCEAWSLALEKRSIFPDPIEAWVHGPVISAVFHSYKEYRWSAIPLLKHKPSANSDVREHVSSVLDAYGGFGAVELERLTHSEEPWLEARNGLEPDFPSRAHISRETMQKFYSAQVV